MWFSAIKLAINAGSKITPQLPFIETGLSFGKNISVESAMTDSEVSSAVEYGRIVGRNMASLTDCLVIGESIPGGTTTALAVLKAFDFEKYNFPFDHYIVENFLPEDVAHSITNEFMDYESDNWFVYNNQIENKKALQTWGKFSKETYKLFQYFCMSHNSNTPRYETSIILLN